MQIEDDIVEAIMDAITGGMMEEHGHIELYQTPCHEHGSI